MRDAYPGEISEMEKIANKRYLSVGEVTHELKEAHKRGKMTEVGFAAKPVSSTAAIAAAALFCGSQRA